MKKSLVASMLVLSPFTVMADEPSYNYVEGGYYQLDLDDAEFKGYQLRGSLAFSENLYGRLGYWAADDTFTVFNTNIDVDLSELSAGLGFKTPVGANTTVHTYADLVQSRIDVEGNDDSETDYRLGFGLRSNVAESVELFSDITWTDYDVDNETALQVGGVFHINNAFGITVSAGLNDENDKNYTVGARLSF